MTFFAGTFVRHPLALAAAKAVLHHLKEAGPALQKTLSQKVASAAQAVEASFRGAGLETSVHPCGAWFTFSLPAEARFGSLLYYHLREKGIHILEGYPCFFTTAHSDEDFSSVVEGFRESIQEMRRGGMWPGSAAQDVSQPAVSELLAPAAATLELHPEARGKSSGYEAPTEAPLTEAQREIWLAAALTETTSPVLMDVLTMGLAVTVWAAVGAAGVFRDLVPGDIVRSVHVGGQSLYHVLRLADKERPAQVALLRRGQTQA